MAFPTGLELLTDFTGANGSLKNVAPFGEAHVDGTTFSLERKSNALGRNAGGTGGGLEKNKAGADNGRYITISTLPETAEGYFFWAFRVTKTGSAWNGYGAIFIRTGTSTWVHQLRKYTSGSSSVLGANLSTTALAVGDKIGYSVEGTTLKLWRQASGSETWTELGSRTDSTYSGEGNVAIEATNAGVYDNYFGGTIGAGGTTWKKELADTATATDISVRLPKKVLADTSSTLDATVKRAAKSVSDTQAASDVMSKGAGKALADSSTLTDSVVKRAVKVLADPSSVVDAVIKRPGKLLADGASVADVVESHTLKVLFKLLEDGVLVGDAAARKSAKLFADSLATADALTKAPRKVLADVSMPADASTRKPTMVLADSMAVVDAASFARVLRRVLADGIAVGDASISGARKVLGDSAVVVDFAANTVAKILEDAVALSDAIDANASETIPGLIRKLVVDSVAISDAVSLVRRIAGAGSAGIPDTGNPGHVAGENSGDFPDRAAGGAAASTTGSPAGGRSRL